MISGFGTEDLLVLGFIISACSFAIGWIANGILGPAGLGIMGNGIVAAAGGAFGVWMLDQWIHWRWFTSFPKRHSIRLVPALLESSRLEKLILKKKFSFDR